MDTVASRRHAQISTVIHDQGNTVTQNAPKLPGITQDLSRIARLVAVLDQGCTAGRKLPCILKDRVVRALRR